MAGLKRKQAIGLFCFILFAASALFGIFAPIGWLGWLYGPPVLSYHFKTIDTSYSSQDNQIANRSGFFRTIYNLTLGYFTLFNFSTIGSFSVDNPIDFSLITEMTNLNNGTKPLSLNATLISEFFSAAYFSNSVFENGSSAVIILTPFTGRLADLKGQPPYPIPLYQARGTIDFVAAGTTSLYLFSSLLKNLTYVPNFVPGANPVMDIQPYSDTLSLTFNQNFARLSIVLGIFSWLLLQPIFNAIVPKNKLNNEAASEP